jgi:hypothetical protein
VILVDLANVMGSRPTGWWRDRAGAARKLVEDIRSATADGRIEPPIVVVLEGAARKGEPEGTMDNVRVVHAAGSGDDTMAQLAAEATEPVILISADRELRKRVADAGGDSAGPSWLYERLSQRGE